jgi:hypothetical protein
METGMINRTVYGNPGALKTVNRQRPPQAGVPPYTPPPLVSWSAALAPPPVAPRGVAAVLSLGFGLGAWSMYACAWLIAHVAITPHFFIAASVILLLTAGISLIEALVAIIAGHIGWGRIHAAQGGQRGKGCAVMGLMLGYLALAIVGLHVLSVLALMIAFSNG